MGITQFLYIRIHHEYSHGGLAGSLDNQTRDQSLDTEKNIVHVYITWQY